jgi:uncharacterized membrane protein YdjX (TVP38/TMEM64 family)
MSVPGQEHPRSHSPPLADAERQAKRRLLVGALVLGAVVAAARLLLGDHLLQPLVQAARSSGKWGLALLALAYLPVTLIGLPTMPLTVAAGLTWGPVVATAVALPANTIAACAAFLLGRALVSHGHEALAAGQGRIARAARTLGRGGFRLVLLLRLSWVAPFNVLNYAFGVSPCRFKDFALATLIGSAPILFAYAWAGALLAGSAP